MADEDFDELSEEPIIELIDEDGNTQEYQHLASLVYEDSTYVALIPVYENSEDVVGSDGELVFLKVAYDEQTDEEILETIDNEKELDAVSAQFEEMLEDEYEIVEEDEEPQNR